jgi:isopentenyl phosphate kinase
MTGAGSGGVTLLKLGGSLITDKERPTRSDRPHRGRARSEVIRRLAAEVAETLAGDGRARLAGRLVLGHGSGSFGHVAAARHRVHEGLAPERRAGVSQVQQRAADLHRIVVGALVEAGAAPFSIAPSSSLVTAGGRPEEMCVEPVLLALGAGLMPVVYGDVVMDRDRGCAIASTETVFLALEAALSARGTRVERVLWAGATDGVLDAAGRRLLEIHAASGAATVDAAGGASGTDVTGGMRHRVEAALELARRGVPSLVFDGTVPGSLAAALCGREVGGTRVVQ